MSKSPRRKEWMGTLASREMDVSGMEGLLVLYRNLAPVASEGMAPAARPKKISAGEARARLTGGFHILDVPDLAPAAGDLAGRLSAVLTVFRRHSEADTGGLAPEILAAKAPLYLEKGEQEAKEEISRAGMDPEAGFFLLFNALKGVFLTLRHSLPPVEDSSWDLPTCPLCGDLPAVGTMEGEGGRRHLICQRCEAKWPWLRIHCPFCGNDDHRTLSYLYLEGSPRPRMDVCERCGAYLKVWDLRDAGTLFPEVEDLLTPGYDAAAAAKGYRRGSPNIFGIRMGKIGGL